MSNCLEDALSFEEHDLLMKGLDVGGDPNCLKQLVDKGIDLNQVIDESQNLHPIHWACGYGNLEAVKILLDAGEDINVKDGGMYEYTPLDHAVKHKHITLAKYLLETGEEKTEWTEFLLDENELKELLG